MVGNVIEWVGAPFMATVIVSSNLLMDGHAVVSSEKPHFANLACLLAGLWLNCTMPAVPLTPKWV